MEVGASQLSAACALDLIRTAIARRTGLDHWDDETLVEVGVLKRLRADRDDKPMHAAQSIRGREARSAMLRHIDAQILSSAH